MKAVVVTFSDGRMFAIPAIIFARDRAHYFAEGDAARGDGKYEEVYAAELAYTLRDEDELLDWVANNNNWSDVEQYAVELPSRSRELDYEDEWTNSDREVVEVDDKTFPYDVTNVPMSIT